MSWIEKHLAGHTSIGRVTLYGFNAMHVAVNIWTRRWGYICFHPPMRCFRTWWPWYFYLSPNATPWASTVAVGPGVSAEDKREAKWRRAKFGHGFSLDGLEYADYHPRGVQ